MGHARLSRSTIWKHMGTASNSGVRISGSSNSVHANYLHAPIQNASASQLQHSAIIVNAQCWPHGHYVMFKTSHACFGWVEVTTRWHFNDNTCQPTQRHFVTAVYGLAITMGFARRYDYIHLRPLHHAQIHSPHFPFYCVVIGRSETIL